MHSREGRPSAEGCRASLRGSKAVKRGPPPTIEASAFASGPLALCSTQAVHAKQMGSLEMSLLEWVLLVLFLGVLVLLTYCTGDRKARSPEQEADINAAKEAARRADKWAH
jgi:hypothetical protein